MHPTPDQARYLRTIIDARPQSQAELARLMGVSRAAAGKVVLRLRERGLLEDAPTGGRVPLAPTAFAMQAVR